MNRTMRIAATAIAAGLVLSLSACNRISWGPEGMNFAVGDVGPKAPPFEVDESLVLRPEDIPPVTQDRTTLNEAFNAAIAAGLIPTSGSRAVVAWLLIDSEGRVAEYRLEEGSGDEAFDEMFELGISGALFSPALRPIDEADDRTRAVPVWMQFPYRISWQGRDVRGGAAVAGEP